MSYNNMFACCSQIPPRLFGEPMTIDGDRACDVCGTLGTYNVTHDGERIAVCRSCLRDLTTPIGQSKKIRFCPTGNRGTK